MRTVCKQTKFNKPFGKAGLVTEPGAVATGSQHSSPDSLRQHVNGRLNVRSGRYRILAKPFDKGGLLQNREQ
jgi:hypothetical protein